MEHMLLTIERKLNHMDTNVAALVADVAQIKADVKAVAGFVAAVVARQAVAIDDEDLAQIKATHADLVLAHNGLQEIVAPAPAATPAA